MAAANSRRHSLLEEAKEELRRGTWTREKAVALNAKLKQEIEEEEERRRAGVSPKRVTIREGDVEATGGRRSADAEEEKKDVEEGKKRRKRQRRVSAWAKFKRRLGGVRNGDEEDEDEDDDDDEESSDSEDDDFDDGEDFYEASDPLARLLRPIDMSAILAKDPYQHEMNVPLCGRVTLAYSCIMLSCHVPWIVAMVVLLQAYHSSTPAPQPPPPPPNSNETVPSAQDLQIACDHAFTYVFAFAIIFFVNAVFGCIAAIARSVDGGRNLLVGFAPYVLYLITLAIVAINILGVVYVWSSVLWSPWVSPSCASLRDLSVSLLVFFLALPFSCCLLGIFLNFEAAAAGTSPSSPNDGVSGGNNANGGTNANNNINNIHGTGYVTSIPPAEIHTDRFLRGAGGSRDSVGHSAAGSARGGARGMTVDPEYGAALRGERRASTTTLRKTSGSSSSNGNDR